MTKFKFELQDVLDLRNYEKEAAENELSKALDVEAQINNELEYIASEYVRVKQLMKGSRDIDDIICQNNFFKFLDSKKEDALGRLAEAKIITDQKRVVLMECMKKTTALEKLKEKQTADFKADEDYRESEFIDDLATSRYKLSK